ncbi:hypothetical protein [Chromobacterium haemolyticum]|uniref:hypothetical protein n=1 Tax=Chromobacterium haemolyticum TaxID=394935 RepID=UPI0005B89ED8|nr:hypothetical protein [Chromobacterium haemolyticum]
MTYSIYELIFLISSDCFNQHIFNSQSTHTAEAIQKIARNITPLIMEGGEDYFDDVDFSKKQIDFIENKFTSELENNINDKAAISKVYILKNIIDNENEYRRTAENTLISICAHIYWLNTTNLTQAISDSLFNTIEKVESLGLTTTTPPQLDWSTIKDIWNASETPWDSYLKKITSEVPDSLCSAFNYLTNNDTQLDFLIQWKEHLSENEFSALKTFLAVEGEQELKDINSKAFEEYKKIITFI